MFHLYDITPAALGSVHSLAWLRMVPIHSYLHVSVLKAGQIL